MKKLDFARMYVTSGPDGRSWVYDVERLWRLAEAEPVIDVPMVEFDGLLDERHSWGDEPTNRQIARHARRIFEADLSYPILMFADGTVVDGIHRILKAWLAGHATIRAVRFAADPEPDGVLPAHGA